MVKIEPARSTFMDGTDRIAYYVTLVPSLGFQELDMMTWRAMVAQDLDRVAARDNWSVAVLPITETEQSSLRAWSPGAVDAFARFNRLLIVESEGHMRSLVDYGNGIVRVIRRNED